MVPGWNSAEAKAPVPQQLPAPAVGAGGGVATLPAVRPGTADTGLVCNTTAGPPTAQQPAMPGSAGKSDGSNLFDALLLAASGGAALSEFSLLNEHPPATRLALCYSDALLTDTPAHGPWESQSATGNDLAPPFLLSIH